MAKKNRKYKKPTEETKIKSDDLEILDLTDEETNPYLEEDQKALPETAEEIHVLPAEETETKSVPTTTFNMGEALADALMYNALKQDEEPKKVEEPKQDKKPKKAEEPKQDEVDLYANMEAGLEAELTKLDSEAETAETESEEKQPADLAEALAAVVEEEILKQKEEKKQKTRIMMIILAAIVVVVVIGCIIGVFQYKRSLVYKTVRVEAGIEVSAQDFLKKADENASFAEGSDEIDIHTPGEYHLLVSTKGFTNKVTLIIQDTVAPEVTCQNLTIVYGAECQPEDFVVSYQDETEVSYAFSEEPDYETFGDQKLTIVATDLGSNTTETEVTLTITPVVESLVKNLTEDLPGVEDFLVDASIEGATLVTDLSDIDTGVEGEYDIEIEVGGQTYTSKLIYQLHDEDPPVIEVTDLSGYIGVTWEASEFIVSCEDLTEVTYSFESEPDCNLVGSQSLVVIATDARGNQSQADVTLTLAEDTEAPTVSASDVSIRIGNTVTYKNLYTVSDNCEKGLNVSVDSSAVDLKTAGSYTVSVTATDAAGNTASTSFTITVVDNSYTEDEVIAMANSALAAAGVTDSMSDQEKCEAIFKWTRQNITYYDESDKSSWIQAAGDGFLDKRGDCFTYASIAKVMLTQAGITNMDIERIPEGDKMHFWNIVYIEKDGAEATWYHFDTTPRASEHPYICLWDDATLMAYSQRNNNCHNYDRTKYPTIP